MPVYEVKYRYQTGSREAQSTEVQTVKFSQQNTIVDLFRAIRWHGNRTFDYGSWDVIWIVELPEVKTAKEN